jgi:hypothetical protein
MLRGILTRWIIGCLALPGAATLPAQAPASARAMPVLLDTTTVGHHQYTRRIARLEVVARPAVTERLTPAGTFRCAFNKGLKLQYTALQAGDTLVLQMRGNGVKPLHTVRVLNPEQQQLAGTATAMNFEARVPVQTGGPITLEVRTRPALRKQFALVEALRIRPQAPDSFLILTDSIFRKNSVTLYDTLLVTLLDDSLRLEPLWNLEAQPFGFLYTQIPFALDSQTYLRQVACWTGTGPEAISAYQAYEKTVPPEWSKPGAPPALGAYALGRFLALPRTAAAEGLDQFFCNAADKERVRQGKKPQQRFWTDCAAHNYCLQSVHKETLGGMPLTKKKNFDLFVCFRNRRTVVGYNLAVKMVGCYVKTTVKPAPDSLVQVKNDKKPFRR